MSENIIKVVIFDLDGTLGDTLPLCIAAFKKAIEPITHKCLSEEEIIATFGPSEEGTIMALIPDFYERGISEYLKYYEELHDMSPAPFEGILALLQWLKSNNITVAMVTGKGQKSCAITLDRYRINAYFEMVETGSALGQRKSEGIQAVLDKFQVKPEEAFYVGDAVSDITCARRVNVPIISAAWADTTDISALESLRPDQLFTSVDEFRDFLENCILK